MKIILTKPRGFCAGVERAIQIVERAIEIYGKPIYVRHQIVHNEFVVESLEKKGAVFVEELSEIPKESKVVLSAHGSPPKVKQEAEQLNLTVLDAVCPLVTKVHNEAINYSKQGYEIILIGHKGHQEVKGTMGYAKMTLIENEEDVKNLSIPEHTEKILYLTQTTLSVDETKDIILALKKKYPHITAPPKDDICYATTNRQTAVKQLTKIAQLILVIGSHNSSNSCRLVETAKQYGAQSYLVPNKDAIKEEWIKNNNTDNPITTIGITSGASVPDTLVHEVVDTIKELIKPEETQIEEHEFLPEKIHFPLPKDLRKEE